MLFAYQDGMESRHKTDTLRGMDAVERPVRTLATSPGQKPRPTMAIGAVTQRFFLEGEEQEASEYKNVILEADALERPSLGFDSFDKIPRKRTPMVAVAASVSLIALGVVAWKTGFSRLSTQGASVYAAIHAMVTATPVAKPTIEPARPVSQPIAAVTSSAPDKEAAVEPSAQRPPTPVANAISSEASAHRLAKVAKPSDVRVIELIRPASSAIAAGETQSNRSALGTRPAPLRGYVWSPEANALVPAERSAAESGPGVAASPEPTAPPERRIDYVPADKKSPAPAEEPRRSSLGTAPIIE